MALEYQDTLKELVRVQEIVETDAPLKAALEANKRLEAQVAQLRESLNGKIAENTELVRRVKSLQAKLKKAGIE